MTNLIIGKGKTVHNGLCELPDGTRVPSCSVGVAGKTITETDAAVTCKTCSKRTPARGPVCTCAAVFLDSSLHESGCALAPELAPELAPAFSHNAALCSVKGCEL